MVGRMIVAGSLALLQQAAPVNPGALSREQFNQQIALEAVRHPYPNGAIAIFVPLGLFAMVAVLVLLRMRLRQRAMQAQAELHKQLMDKFTSGPDLAKFIESPGGQRYLDELRSLGARSRERTLVFGGVLFFLGVAMIGLSRAMPAAPANAPLTFHSSTGLLVWGVLSLAAGAGFLASAVISRRLSQKFNPGAKAGPGGAPIS